MNNSNIALELQKALEAAQALANSAPSNLTMAQDARVLVKEIVDKLVQANKTGLENEKSRLRMPISSHVNAQHHSQNTQNMRPTIQRNYELTAKSSYEVWLDCLKTELTSWSLLDLIDPSVPGPIGLPDKEKTQRKNYVKEIIITHINEDYLGKQSRFKF